MPLFLSHIDGVEYEVTGNSPEQIAQRIRDVEPGFGETVWDRENIGPTDEKTGDDLCVRVWFC